MASKNKPLIPGMYGEGAGLAGSMREKALRDFMQSRISATTDVAESMDDASLLVATGVNDAVASYIESEADLNYARAELFRAQAAAMRAGAGLGKVEETSVSAVVEDIDEEFANEVERVLNEAAPEMLEDAYDEPVEKSEDIVEDDISDEPIENVDDDIDNSDSFDSDFDFDFSFDDIEEEEVYHAPAEPMFSDVNRTALTVSDSADEALADLVSAVGQAGDYNGTEIDFDGLHEAIENDPYLADLSEESELFEQVVAGFEDESTDTTDEIEDDTVESVSDVPENEMFDEEVFEEEEIPVDDDGEGDGSDDGSGGNEFIFDDEEADAEFFVDDDEEVFEEIEEEFLEEEEPVHEAVDFGAEDETTDIPY